MRRPYDPRSASGILLRGILLVPAYWVALFGLLVLLAWVYVGEWPHGHGFATPGSCPRHTNVGPLAHQYSSIDPKHFGILSTLLWESALPVFAASILGALLLLASIAVRELRLSSAWWGTFLLSNALGIGIVAFDLGGLRNWLAD